jgi:hypothetical protein
MISYILMVKFTENYIWIQGKNITQPRSVD